MFFLVSLVKMVGSLSWTTCPGMWVREPAYPS
nr:MAG TPA: hypothetical protein [Caudoviricetes sp.]DAJ10635.1 MAG TPA: hypothetical protein [Caudoviricetes sp.]